MVTLRYLATRGGHLDVVDIILRSRNQQLKLESQVFECLVIINVSNLAVLMSNYRNITIRDKGHKAYANTY